MAPNPADPIALVAKLLAIMIGIELAAIAAPHVVIILAGAIGSVFGLMAWRTCSRPEAAGYVIAMTCVAWLFAGSVAQVLTAQAGLDAPGPLLAPAAAAIGWIGHRWPAVGAWALMRAKKLIESRTTP